VVGTEQILLFAALMVPQGAKFCPLESESVYYDFILRTIQYSSVVALAAAL